MKKKTKYKKTRPELETLTKKELILKANELKEKLCKERKDRRIRNFGKVRIGKVKIGDIRKQLKKNVIHVINDSKIIHYSISYQERGILIRIKEGNKKDWEKQRWKNK